MTSIDTLSEQLRERESELEQLRAEVEAWRARYQAGELRDFTRAIQLLQLHLRLLRPAAAFNQPSPNSSRCGRLPATAFAIAAPSTSFGVMPPSEWVE